MAKTGPKRKFNPPVEELRELYEKMSMKAIAQHYGVGETVVFKRIKEYGFKRISRSERLTGKPKSPDHIEKMREAGRKLVGENNPNWRGGVTPEYIRKRSTKAFLNWKQAVRDTAGWQCEKCGIKHGKQPDGRLIYLHTHHIKPLHKFPELMYEPDNGLCLCPKCHYREHNWKTG